MYNRIGLMLWGIAGPEFLVIFAYRQWRGCKDITRAIQKMVMDQKLGHLSSVYYEPRRELIRSSR